MDIYYKSLRCINGEPKWILSDKNGKIVNRNPTIDQLRVAVFDRSQRSRRIRINLEKRACCMCGANDTPLWCSCKCSKKDCTRWMCSNCGAIYYQKNDPNSTNNITKLSAQWRNGDLDPFSPPGKGFIGQQIVAKTFNVEDCNLKMDNFRFYIDLYKQSEHGYCEVKTASMNGEIWSFNTRRVQKYDTLLLVCMDINRPWKDVRRIYAIPYKEIADEVMIHIYEYWSKVRGGSKFERLEKFRINEKQFNDTYHKMDIKRCKILRKDEFAKNE